MSYSSLRPVNRLFLYDRGEKMVFGFMFYDFFIIATNFFLINPENKKPPLRKGASGRSAYTEKRPLK